MDINEAGRNAKSGRIDNAQGVCAVEVPDRIDPPVTNTDVGRDPIASRSVDNRTLADNQIEAMSEPYRTTGTSAADESG
jgi:hypothetical protein